MRVEAKNWIRQAAAYPDAANGVPADLYDEPIASDRVERARRIFAWARPYVDEALS